MTATVSTPVPCTVPVVPRTPAARIRRALADSATMTRRGFALWRRRPVQLAIEMSFGVMMLVMFGYLLGGGMDLGGGNYREYLVPGMLTLTMAFGLEATMVALTQDINKGLLDRFRSMPIAPSAVLIGRSVIDMVTSVVSLLVMIGAGLAIGWRWHGSLAAGLAAVGLLLLLRFAMLWAGIYLALLVGKPEMVQAVQILVWPVAFLSNAFVSPDKMPAWIGALADWNPLSATAAAVRDLFGNPDWGGGGAWVTDHAVLLAVLWPLALLALFIPLAIHRFTGLGRG